LIYGSLPRKLAPVGDYNVNRKFLFTKNFFATDAEGARCKRHHKGGANQDSRGG
jgi:hypothetical protein